MLLVGRKTTVYRRPFVGLKMAEITLNKTLTGRIQQAAIPVSHDSL